MHEIPWFITQNFPSPSREMTPRSHLVKKKFNREDKSMEESRGNNKAKLKVEIYDLLKKHFTNVIWKENPSLRFIYMSIFCNVHTSALSKYEKVCTLGMLQQCSSP